MSDTTRPIIRRKRIVVADGGHHGGAWKVAYADFVTAMMAFFLLMWLLGATNETQRKGIADYFTPTVPVNRTSGGGDGAFGGDTVFTKNLMTQEGIGAGLIRPTEVTADTSDAAASVTGTPDPSAETQALRDVADDLTGRSGESMVSDTLRRHILSKVTDEGLVVEVFALPDVAIFDDADQPTPLLQDILTLVADTFGRTRNEIAIHGHLPARPIVEDRGRGWQASVRRADVTRETLEAISLSPDRFARISGFADSRPVSGDPFSVRNDRLEIILLRHNR